MYGDICGNRFKEKIMSDTVDIQGVPIFSTGIWEGNGSAKGGDAFSEKDLDEIVETFNAVGSKVKPRMILGHDKGKSEKFSGYPSLGWVTKLYRDGKKLKADFKAVPEKIKSLIDKKAYGRFSPGIWKRMNINGKDHYKVMDHVALLGGTLPANMGLDGFIDLYEIDNNNELVRYFTKQEQKMDDKVQVQIDEMSAQLKDLQAQLEDKNKVIESLESEKNDMKVKFEKEQADRERTEIESVLKDAQKDNKITPAQMPLFMALALNKDGVVTYEHKEDDTTKNIDGNRIELIKQIFDNHANVPVDEKSVDGETSNVTYSKQDNKDDRDELDEKITAYAKEHNVSYTEAFDAVVDGGE